jgi:hypothetical protein
MTQDDIINNIKSGLHDSILTELNAVINARLALVRGSRTVSEFGIGDRVQFNSLCGTRYLIGATGQITGRRRTKVVVILDKPTGRFVRHTSEGPVSAEITVPTSIIDLAS